MSTSNNNIALKFYIIMSFNMQKIQDYKDKFHKSKKKEEMCMNESIKRAELTN